MTISTHEQAVRLAKLPRKRGLTRCIVCAKAVPGTMRRLYCSNRCKKRAQREGIKGPQRIVVCPNCRHAFIPKGIDP